jgi:hypothetical protein
MTSEAYEGGTEISKWMTRIELFESSADEKAFKKVVSVDRRIEMQSKSEVFPTRHPAEKIGSTNGMN